MSRKTLKIKLWISLCSVILFSSIDGKENAPVVSVRQGKLKGSVEPLLDDFEYFSFKGIPYAQVPARFMDPVPPSNWEGIHEATKHGAVCSQYDVILGKYRGEENCLFLNVYTKSLKPDAKLPVMVFLHGGSYMYSSGNNDIDDGLGPEFLIQHDVILVTLNYRLEVFGFLSLDIPEVPGNAGMKDQVAALRWIQNNIAQFGGDPKNVTLFGESSGSSSVTYHMHSPMSRNLFQKAIAQSGVSTADWAQMENGRDLAFRVSKHLGSNATDAAEVLKFLRSVPAKKLNKITFKIRTKEEIRRDPPMLFVPVVEKIFKGVEMFLTENTIDALQSGRMINKIPLMIGYNTMEALQMVEDELKKVNFTNANPQYLVPRLIADKVSNSKELDFGKRIKDFYTGNKNFTQNDFQIMGDMLSDRHFIYNIQRFAHFYSSLANTYLYKFNCDTDLNIVKILSGYSDKKGASHGDEIFYLFYGYFNRKAYHNAEPKSKEIVSKITKLWTDFAKTGNPTPENGVKWDPYTPSNRAYMDINEQLIPGKDVDRARVDFWDKIYCESGSACIAKNPLLNKPFLQ